MEEILVSVVIPTYNRANTIIECLDSVCKQTYTNLDIIVVDDCSTDNTKEIIHRYCDKRVRYHCLEKNSGACVARNKGVELANGDIIAFQDSDDKWHTDKVEKQVQFLESGKYDFVTCGFIRHMDKTDLKMGYSDCPENKEKLWCKLLNGNWISTQTILCYKYCFDKISFDKNVKRFQDWDLALQASLYYKIGCMDDYLVDVYVQKDSITKTQNTQESIKYILNKHFSDISPLNREMVSQYYKSFGDVIRLSNTREALKYYKISQSAKFSIKIAIVETLCATGLIKVYDKKYM